VRAIQITEFGGPETLVVRDLPDPQPGDSETVMRPGAPRSAAHAAPQAMQQLSGAGTAKSKEDCLFYRDARLVSLNEVGGEPARFGVSIAEFHQRAATRARLWPQAMVALSTHDTKRGEDVRARIGVLSQVPSHWAELVGKWARQAPPPDPATGLFLLQNVFGVWPADGVVTDELRTRLHAYAEKAIREAAVHTSWNDPDAAFETAVHAWLDAIMDGPVATDLTSLVTRLDQHARTDGLGQKLVALTVPAPGFFQLTLAVFWLMAFSSATHDIAADGFYMLATTEREQSFFVGIRSMFYRVATIAAQGGLDPVSDIYGLTETI